MTNNPSAGYHPNNRWVLSYKQQIIALSKVCNVNNKNVLKIADQKDVLRIFTNFYGTSQKSVSGQQLPQILPSSNERFFLAQK
jgi:hypothetical protein